MHSHKIDNKKWVELIDKEIERFREKKLKTTSEKKIESINEKITNLEHMKNIFQSPIANPQMLSSLKALMAEHRDKGIKGVLKLNFFRSTKGEENFKETQKQIEKANEKKHSHK